MYTYPGLYQGVAKLLKHYVIDDNKDILITWLNDAYSMELAIIDTLEGHAKDAEDYPEMKQMIETHTSLTRSQAERVKEEIERLGGEISGTKSTLARVMGAIQGVMPDLAMDKVIKNAITEHATEHFEHASYLSLAEAADYFDEPETVRVCREIMREEMETGEKLEKMIPELTREFLERQEESE